MTRIKPTILPPVMSHLLLRRRPIGTQHQRGVSLIEILITLLVLAIGLLGLAALQGFTLQSGQTSYYRTQATNVGYEVADFARTNRSRITQSTLQTKAKDLAQQSLPQGDAVVRLDSDGTVAIDVSWLDDRSEPAPESVTFSFSTRI
ncbi:MAG: type IV pilus modification protein PilV [Wenzhouxiangellaceae bacterium]|nr:type IV pilus modification protein PilV [Wenzhouxiangellaceae bacterium]